MKLFRIFPLVLALVILPGTLLFSQAVIQNRDRQSESGREAEPAEQPGGRAGTRAPSGTHRVTIDSNIEGADIYVDERFMGETPLTLDLTAGRHSVMVRLPKFQEFRRDINVRGPMTVDARLVRRTAQVDIRVPENVLGSGPWYQSNALSLTIDGDRIREESVDLPEGTHTVVFTYGNLSFEETFEVTAGQRYTLEPVFSIRLQPLGSGAEQGEQGLQVGEANK